MKRNRTKRSKAAVTSAIVVSIVGCLLFLLFVAQKMEVSAVTISSQPARDVHIVLRQNIFGDSNLYLVQGAKAVFVTRILSFDRDEKLLEVRWDEGRDAYALKISRAHGRQTEDILLPLSRQTLPASAPQPPTW